MTQTNDPLLLPAPSGPFYVILCISHLFYGDDVWSRLVLATRATT